MRPRERRPAQSLPEDLRPGREAGGASAGADYADGSAVNTADSARTHAKCGSRTDSAQPGTAADQKEARVFQPDLRRQEGRGSDRAAACAAAEPSAAAAVVIGWRRSSSQCGGAECTRRRPAKAWSALPKL